MNFQPKGPIYIETLMIAASKGKPRVPIRITATSAGGLEESSFLSRRPVLPSLSCLLLTRKGKFSLRTMHSPPSLPPALFSPPTHSSQNLSTLWLIFLSWDQRQLSIKTKQNPKNLPRKGPILNVNTYPTMVIT